MKPPEGKKFYGSVTVSERGQVVIPAGARKDFNIRTGDKLLVFGDLQQGIALAPFDIMARTMEGAMDLFRDVGSKMKVGGGKPSRAGKNSGRRK